MGESSDETSTARHRSAAIRRQRLFKAFMVAIPIAFFVLLELGLRVANYGESIPLFLELTEDARFLYPNQELAKRYFRSKSSLPTIPYQTFRKNREEVDIRVVIQGGSSAAGYPYYFTGGMADYLEQYLRLGNKGKSVEVINTALSAVNSFTLLDLANEVIAIEPDVVILYAGHNEYYGALGVASTESSFTSPAFVRTYLRLRRLRMVQLLQNLIYRRANGPAKDGTLMGRMVGESTVPFGSNLYNRGLTQFQQNLGLLIDKYRRAKIPVLLSTVVSNEADFPPFEWAGQPRDVRLVEDMSVTTAERSIATDSMNALALYVLASHALNSADTAKAKLLYRRARDADALRFRAPSKINSLIREIASEDELVDNESILEEYSENGIIGSALITEHLHPTPLGYRLIAKSFFAAIRDRNILANVDVQQAEPTEVDGQVAIDSLAGAYRLVQIMSAWPFVPLDNSRWVDTLKAAGPVEEIALNVFRNKIGRLSAINEVQAHYQSTGEYDKAVAAINGAVRQMRHLPDLPLTAGMIMSSQGELGEARSYFEQTNLIQPLPDAFRMLGNISLQLGENQRARLELERALQFAPRDQQVLFNLALAYARLSEFDKAAEAIGKLLTIEPTHRDGNTLLKQIQAAANRN